MNIRSEYSLIGIGAGIGWALACWRFWREREAVLDRLAGARRFALVQQSVNESLMDALRRGGERRATWPNDAASIRAGIPWPDPPPPLGKDDGHVVSLHVPMRELATKPSSSGNLTGWLRFEDSFVAYYAPGVYLYANGAGGWTTVFVDERHDCGNFYCSGALDCGLPNRKP